MLQQFSYARESYCVVPVELGGSMLVSSQDVILIHSSEAPLDMLHLLFYILFTDKMLWSA